MLLSWEGAWTVANPGIRKEMSGWSIMHDNGREYLHTFPKSKIKTPSMDQVILHKTVRKHTTLEKVVTSTVMSLYLNHMPYTAPCISGEHCCHNFNKSAHQIWTWSIIIGQWELNSQQMLGLRCTWWEMRISAPAWSLLSYSVRKNICKKNDL